MYRIPPLEQLLQGSVDVERQYCKGRSIRLGAGPDDDVGRDVRWEESDP